MVLIDKYEVFVAFCEHGSRAAASQCICFSFNAKTHRLRLALKVSGIDYAAQREGVLSQVEVKVGTLLLNVPEINNCETVGCVQM